MGISSFGKKKGTIGFADESADDLKISALNNQYRQSAVFKHRLTST